MNDNVESYITKTHKILDACCGSRMFYFDKNNPNVDFMDIRSFETILCDGRKLKVKPDIVADFRKMPFKDNTYKLVVFDPPHLNKVGENSWIAKKYGRLGENWTQDIKKGFDECMRVLEPYGVLIFKWNEEQISLKQLLECLNKKPLFGNKRSKTHWLVFIKEGEATK